MRVQQSRSERVDAVLESKFKDLVVCSWNAAYPTHATARRENYEKVLDANLGAFDYFGPFICPVARISPRKQRAHPEIRVHIFSKDWEVMRARNDFSSKVIYRHQGHKLRTRRFCVQLIDAAARKRSVINR